MYYTRASARVTGHSKIDPVHRVVWLMGYAPVRWLTRAEALKMYGVSPVAPPIPKSEEEVT